MCIFPEGGIPNTDIFLKNFKNGPFRLAVEQEVSIVPISLPDNKKLFPQEYFKGRPGFVKIKMHFIKCLNASLIQNKTSIRYKRGGLF